MNKLRVYFHILGADIYYREVATPEEAKIVIDSIASFVNFQVDNGVFPDHCSSAGLEMWDEEEHDWLDWYDEDGWDFNQHFDHANGVLATIAEEQKTLSDTNKAWSDALETCGYIN